MKKKPSYTMKTSKVKSRSDEHIGLFTERTVSYDQESWHEGEKLSDEVFGPHRNLDPERDVMEYIGELEDLARHYAKEKGYTSWFQAINDGENGWIAGTTTKSLTRDHFAYQLEGHCRSLRESRKKEDFFKSLLYLARV